MERDHFHSAACDDKSIELLEDSLLRVHALLLEAANESTEPMQGVTIPEVAARGKMLRPKLLLLCSSIYGRGSDTRAAGLAAVIEMTHLATLCHDDVLDEGTLRRSRPTLRARSGNTVSILAGDYLLTRALKLLSQYGDLAMVRALSVSLGRVIEGEFAQNARTGKVDISHEEYLRTASWKTGELFAAAAELGALLGGAPKDETTALREFGLMIGTAFQIADDYLDYVGTSTSQGKMAGQDFSCGVATLPLIEALRVASPENREFLLTRFGCGRVDSRDWHQVVSICRDALERTVVQIGELAIAARRQLADTVQGQGCRVLTGFSYTMLEDRLAIASSRLFRRAKS